jgi:guanine deaminase
MADLTTPTLRSPKSRAASGTQAYRGRVLHFTGDPQRAPDATHYWEDGLLIIAEGKVVSTGEAVTLLPTLPPDTVITDYRGMLIMPGMIDTHIHYPQTDIIASPAPGLLPWLETYTFPEEQCFADGVWAAQVASFFLDTLLSHGTTTAMVWSTVHQVSAEALFQAAAHRDMRLITGKVLMDRNCPPALRDTAESGARESAELITRWHGTQRLGYALTVRFAPTSSPAQLAACGELAQQYDDVFIQTHVAENQDEMRWVAELFPDSRSYLDVYDRVGLLRPRAMYGHAIYLDELDRARLAESGAAVAHCPTSNLFLGSGLYDFSASDRHGIKLTLASDVGGGNTFSMLAVMNEAHKVAQLGGNHLSATRMFYMATRGAAEALHWAEHIGSFTPGCEADFIVLDPRCTPVLARRSARCETLEEQLIALAMLGDDRAVHATYLQGVQVYRDSIVRSSV